MSRRIDTIENKQREEARERYQRAADTLTVQSAILCNMVVAAARDGLVLPPYLVAEMNAYLEAHRKTEERLATWRALGG